MQSLIDDEAEAGMAAVMDAVRAVRNLRAEVGASPGKPVNLTIVAAGDMRARIERNAGSLESLARIGELSFADAIPEADKGKYLSAHLPGLDLYVEAAGLIDVEKELARIDSELASIEKELARSEGKLSNEKFTSRAPADVVEKERRIVAELTEKKQKLLERKAALAG